MFAPWSPTPSMIFDILIGFRVHKIALVRDLEKAFLNVEVDQGQRNFLRFLWVDNIASNDLNFVTVNFAAYFLNLSAPQLG